MKRKLLVLLLVAVMLCGCITPARKMPRDKCWDYSRTNACLYEIYQEVVEIRIQLTRIANALE